MIAGRSLRSKGFRPLPGGAANGNGPLAQSVEQLTFNQ